MKTAGAETGLLKPIPSCGTAQKLYLNLQLFESCILEECLQTEEGRCFIFKEQKYLKCSVTHLNNINIQEGYMERSLVSKILSSEFLRVTITMATPPHVL